MIAIGIHFNKSHNVTRPFPHMTTRTLSIDESPHTIAARTDDDREEAKRSEAKQSIHRVVVGKPETYQNLEQLKCLARSEASHQHPDHREHRDRRSISPAGSSSIHRLLLHPPE